MLRKQNPFWKPISRHSIDLTLPERYRTGCGSGVGLRHGTDTDANGLLRDEESKYCMRQRGYTYARAPRWSLRLTI
jgi:hypothetical protein